MEKFSQYRDRGTGVAPFLPISSGFGPIQIPFATALLLLRLPLFITLNLGYFLVLQFLPISALLKKGVLWALMIVAGVWWIDFSVEGVKRGTLSRNADKLPRAGSILVSTLTSPLDALYLAATFDPIFVLPVYGTSQVRLISLLEAILYPLSVPTLRSPPTSDTSSITTLATLIEEYPDSIIAVFPEGTTTNGRALLTFAPCLTPLLSYINNETTPIFPISLRYTPSSVVTPIPHAYTKFLWRLLGRQTHSVKVRIGEAIIPVIQYDSLATSSSSETITEKTISREREKEREGQALKAGREGELEDRVGEALAKIGRIRRVGLGLKEKVGFWEAWKNQEKKVRT